MKLHLNKVKPNHKGDFMPFSNTKNFFGVWMIFILLSGVVSLAMADGPSAGQQLADRQLEKTNLEQQIHDMENGVRSLEGKTDTFSQGLKKDLEDTLYNARNRLNEVNNEIPKLEEQATQERQQQAQPTPPEHSILDDLGDAPKQDQAKLTPPIESILDDIGPDSYKQPAAPPIESVLDDIGPNSHKPKYGQIRLVPSLRLCGGRGGYGYYDRYGYYDDYGYYDEDGYYWVDEYGYYDEHGYFDEEGYYDPPPPYAPRPPKDTINLNGLGYSYGQVYGKGFYYLPGTDTCLG